MSNFVATTWDSSYWSSASSFPYDQITGDMFYTIGSFDTFYTIANVDPGYVIDDYTITNNAIIGTMRNGAYFEFTGIDLNSYNPIFTNLYIDDGPFFYLDLDCWISPFTFLGNITYLEVMFPDAMAIFYGDIDYGYNSSIIGSVSEMTITDEDVSITIEGDIYLSMSLDGYPLTDTVFSGTADKVTFVRGGESFEASGGAWSVATIESLQTFDQIVNYLNTGDDTFAGGLGNDIFDAGLGNDIFDGDLGNDTIYFMGYRSDYVLANIAYGYQVQDTFASGDGTDDLYNIETLQFEDCTVDLLMGQKASSISAADLKVLEELYVGFFNRIPEAGGLAYWIENIKNGATLKAVADQFYGAGVEYGVYSDTMTKEDFIKTVYANVLGRSGATAPGSGEIGYWQSRLDAGTSSKGDMVLEMINVSHSQYTNDPNVGWVVDLLNHKAEVANYFAVQQGLSYNDAQTSIAKGIAIAAVITPTDTTAAIQLIGVNDFSVAGIPVGY